MTQESEARVYGMADQANRHPPAAEGMRGEKSTQQPEDREAGYEHSVMLGGGRQVLVSEDSGVAYAEATGRAGRAPLRSPGPSNLQQPEPARSAFRSNAVPLLIGLAASALIIGVTLWNRRAGEEQPSEELPLAGL